MNFISAIQHATIGYGIKRKEWNDHLILSSHELVWAEALRNKFAFVQVVLSHEDYTAKDWEAL